jgi:hypothetical protein
MASAICDAFGGLFALALPAHSHQCLRQLPSRRDPKDLGRDHSHGLTEAKSRDEAPDGRVSPGAAAGATRRDLVPGNHHPAHDRQGGERFLRIGSLHRQYFRAAPEACGIGCSKPKVAPWSPAASPNTFAKRGSAPPTVQCRPRRDRLTGPGHREAPLLLRVLRGLERSLGPVLS